MSDPRPPEGGSWPERDLDPQDGGAAPDERPIDEGYRPDGGFQPPDPPDATDWSAPRWFEPEPTGDAFDWGGHSTDAVPGTPSPEDEPSSWESRDWGSPPPAEPMGFDEPGVPAETTPAEEPGWLDASGAAGSGEPTEDAQPDEAQPGDAQPDEAQPGEAQPDEAQPGDAQPSDAQPGDEQEDGDEPEPEQPEPAAWWAAASAMEDRPDEAESAGEPDEPVEAEGPITEPVDEVAPLPADDAMPEEAAAYEADDGVVPEVAAEPHEHGISTDAGQEPPISAAPPITTFGDEGWDPKLQGERRRPTTAEQAVPWLIGAVLALTGIVIVLIALIFTAPGGLASLGNDETPTPEPSSSLVGGVPSASPSGESSGGASQSSQPSASGEPTAQPTSAPTATPPPTYGPLEMAYLGRPTAVAPIYLLRRDFSTEGDPKVLAQANDGVTRFTWAPDGTVGAAIIAGRLVSVTPGQSSRPLADNVSAATFGWDAETVYAVRIVQNGATDRAAVLQIDFVTGAVKTLSSVSYPHPAIAPDPPLREAQFIDDGGTVRIFPVADGNLRVWVLGAPSTYAFDTGDGSHREVSAVPTLWSGDGRYRIQLHEDGSNTTIRLRNAIGNVQSAVRVTGLVSHVRFAPTNNEIVFTLGTQTAAGGVHQDLYVWDLQDGKAPMPLTSNGASFGAEWLGAMPNWLP